MLSLGIGKRDKFENKETKKLHDIGARFIKSTVLSVHENVVGFDEDCCVFTPQPQQTQQTIFSLRVSNRLAPLDSVCAWKDEYVSSETGFRIEKATLLD